MSAALQVQGFASVGTSVITNAWSARDIESAGPGDGIQDTEMILAAAVAAGLYEVKAVATAQTNADTVTVAVTYNDGVLGSSLTKPVMGAVAVAGSDSESGAILIRVAEASDIRLALTLSDQPDTRASATLKRVG